MFDFLGHVSSSQARASRTAKPRKRPNRRGTGREMRFALSISFLLLAPFAATAEVSSDRAAAIVVLPQITVDPTRGVDTFVQLSNADTQNAVDVRCFLEDATGQCLNDPGQPRCLSAAECSSGGDCVLLTTPPAVDFTLRLTAGQPIHWQASAGAASLPLPGNTGSIPPVTAVPFSGILRCLAVDGQGAPVDRNVLKGQATVEQSDTQTPQLDAARYNAVAIEALPGAGDGDGELVFGTAGEYAGCPNTVLISHFFDFVILPSTQETQVFTELTLVPCNADLLADTPAGAVAQFSVFNEFEQRFSTSRAIRRQLHSQISLIDTSEPQRSIFSAGVAGTLGGQTRVNSFGSGVVGMAIEHHHNLAVSGRVASAAYNLHSQGERSEPDVLTVAEMLCSIHPAENCRTSTTRSLFISDNDGAGLKRLAWEWRNGQSTAKAELGDPTDDTNFALCLYQGSPPVRVAALEVPASGAWRNAKSGYRYRDSAAMADGVYRASLIASAVNRSKASLQARGAGLPPIELQSGLTAPVLSQLVNNNTPVCWEATFEQADFLRNGPRSFKASVQP